MDSNLKIFLAEFEKLKGQFVITQSHRIERLIAIGSDEHDYYYITYDGRITHWNTCVGKVIQLKDKIDDEDYDDFIRLAKLNHHDQSTIFGHKPDDIVAPFGYVEVGKEPMTYRQMCEEHKKEMENIKLPDEFLTEVCWDLN